MGLRFRKSVTLCKGLKLNFGKNGMSVSVGGNGVRKTFHSSGRVTTTVGIPGTGIYYTDTKNLKQKNSSQNKSYVKENLYEASFADNYDDMVASEPKYFENDSIIVDSSEKMHNLESVERNPEIIVTDENSDANLLKAENKKHYFREHDIEQIYKKCDPTVEWTEIMSGTSAEELLMSEENWNYCRKYVDRIMSGDIDSYLQVIEDARPLDDLLLYAGDFEYGTDSCDYIEIEFDARVDGVLYKGVNDFLFEKLIKSIALRVARDTMALLPVSNVIVHVVVEDKTVLSVDFDKSILAQIKVYNAKIEDIFSKLEYNMKVEGGKYKEVSRIMKN